MATSDVELQDTLSKLQKTNEESVQLIEQLGTQVDVLVKEVNEFQETLIDPIISPVEPIVPSPILPMPIYPVPTPVEPVVPLEPDFPIEPVPIVPDIVVPVLPRPVNIVIESELPVTVSAEEEITDEYALSRTETVPDEQSCLVINYTSSNGDSLAERRSHKLTWMRDRYKSITIYYKYDMKEDQRWEFHEYREFDYNNEIKFEGTIDFSGDERSNDISNGFTSTDTQNSTGYWSSKFNNSDDDLVYTPFTIRTDEPGEISKQMDNISI